MGRAERRLRERHGGLSVGARRLAGPDSPLHPPTPSRFRPFPFAFALARRAAAAAPALRPGAAFAALAAAAFSLAFAGACSPAHAQTDAPRLLTGLSAKAGPEGVTLAWAVDGSRTDRIAGFTCAYRTPAHLRTGVAGTVPCSPEPSPADRRSRIVAGLPEYGEYLFELVAETAAGASVPWTLRALQARVEVTEALAGAAGPGRAVTGAGPLVEDCRPGEAVAPRPWRLEEIVSAAHLTHYPGRGWAPAGDPAEPPEWPEPTPLTEWVAAAGIEAGEFRRALSSADSEALSRTFADERFAAAVARAGAGTKALLRPVPEGGRELRLHSGYPFGDDYAFGPAHAVPGWADAAHPALWPGLWNRADCPPAGRPDATHDVALALAGDAGGVRLAHSGYGWWAVAPVGLFPERIVATAAGLSYGASASERPEAGARWRGRLTGHLFWDRRRWAVAGDVELDLLHGDGSPRLAGRVENLVLAPIDPKSLKPAAGAGGRLPALALGAGAGPHEDGAWSGPLSLEAAGEAAGGRLEGFPAAGAFRGDWRASAHGPGGAEAAGRLRLWTPLADGADAADGWPGQAVLVAGFGAVRTTP